jgi:hypothetical protein
MSSDKKEKKEKTFRETIDTYTLIKKEDSGVRLKRSIGGDEDSRVKIKPKSTDKSEKRK